MAQRFLLLHGTPLSPQVWDGVRDHLTADAVAVDLTELVDSVRQGCVQTEVAAAVLAALPDDEMVVVGHSFGGQVAIEVALMAPRAAGSTRRRMQQAHTVSRIRRRCRRRQGRSPGRRRRRHAAVVHCAGVG